jgi:hypothetical protein
MSETRKLLKKPEALIIAAQIAQTLRRKTVYKFVDNILNSEYCSILNAAFENKIDPKSLSRGLNNKRGFFKKNNETYKFKN